MSTGAEDKPPDYSGIPRDLVLKWDAAEEAIKRAQVLSDLISLPAINELRFAGRRILDAISADDEIRRSQFFADAYGLCERAQLDALDAQVVYLLSTHKNLPPPRLSEQGLSEYRRLHTVLSELMRVQLEHRASGQHGSRMFEQIVPILNEATDLHLSLLPELISARVGDRRSASVGVAFRLGFIVAGAVAVASIGAALSGLLSVSGL